MGWKITLSAAVVAIVTAFSGTNSPAEARSGWWLCWIPAVSDGGTKCTRLPNNWYIPGVQRKYCQHYVWRCSKATSYFRVSRRNVRALGRYANISTLDLGAYAWVQTRVYR